MRAVDLARTGGISVQQVRNYVDLGLLPPVERTASGYRVFTGEHAEALVAVRRLAVGHGWERTRTIMRAVHDSDVDTALQTLDQGHAELDAERAEIAKVLRAFDTVLSTPDSTREVPRQGARIGAVARAVGVHTSALRVWEQHGLLCPARQRGTEYRIYDAAELRNAHAVALLRRGGYPLSIVYAAVMQELRSTGSPERVRAELAKRGRELYARSLRRLRASAALYGYLEYLGRTGDAPAPSAESAEPGGDEYGTRLC
jgi:DNA-binding transcriptional MerR regulator